MTTGTEPFSEVAVDREMKYREALEKIAAMEDESDEWDGAAKYAEARNTAAEALK